MTPTDYEIARLVSLALLLFAIFCLPAAIAEYRNSTKKQDNDQ